MEKKKRETDNWLKQYMPKYTSLCSNYVAIYYQASKELVVQRDSTTWVQNTETGKLESTVAGGSTISPQRGVADVLHAKGLETLSKSGCTCVSENSSWTPMESSRSDRMPPAGRRCWMQG